MRNSRRRTKRTSTSPPSKVVTVTDEELRQRAVTLEDQYPDIAMFADPDCGQCCGTTAFAQVYGWDRARDYDQWCTIMWMLGYDVKTLAPADD